MNKLKSTLDITKAKVVDVDKATERILLDILTDFEILKIKSPAEMKDEIRIVIRGCLSSIDYRVSALLPVLRASFIAFRNGSFYSDDDASEALTIREDIDGQRHLLYAEGALDNDTVSTASFKITKIVLRYNVFLWPPKGWKIDGIVIDAFVNEQVRYHEYLLDKAIDIRP